ncbi:MAG: hypothetical protein NXI24_18790 [bacterium]|nr:hypothetical protein [bacterium]
MRNIEAPERTSDENDFRINGKTAWQREKSAARRIKKEMRGAKRHLKAISSTRRPEAADQKKASKYLFNTRKAQ